MSKPFECALVGAAPFNSHHFLQESFEAVVAVDGGYASLSAAGVRPCFCLGDFDSLGYVPSEPNVEVHPAMKDDSDTALALSWAHGQGFASVAVYGALGGRLDHTMATLQSLVGFARKGMRLVAVGEDCLVAFLSASGWNELRLPAGLEGTVSVFAASDTARGVSEEGLKYELDNAVLTNGVALGLSNEFTGQESRVSVQEGELMVFLPLMPLEVL